MNTISGDQRPLISFAQGLRLLYIQPFDEDEDDDDDDDNDDETGETRSKLVDKEIVKLNSVYPQQTIG